jgi:hypothetical protein
MRSFVDPGFVLRLLGEEEDNARQLYREMLDSGIETDHVLEQKGAIERFRTKLTSMFPKIFTKASEKGQVSGRSQTKILTMEELERQIQDVKEGKTGDKPTTREAKKFLIEQLIAEDSSGQKSWKN